MSTIQYADLKKILKSAKFTRAVNLNRDKRVYNLKPMASGFTCCVLADTALPWSPSFAENADTLDFNCDCDQATGLPCLHVWALAVRLYQDGSLNNAVLLAAIADQLDPTQRKPIGPTRSPDTHDTSKGEFALFGGSSNQASLFEDEFFPLPGVSHGQSLNDISEKTVDISAKETGERKHHRPLADHSQDIDLFGESSLPEKSGIPDSNWQAAPLRPALPPIQTQPRQLNNLFLVRYQTINRPDLWVETASLPVNTPNSADSLDHSLPSVEARFNLDNRIERSPEKQLSLGSALDDLILIQAGHRSGPQLVCFTTPGRRLELKEFSGIEIKPVLLRVGNDGRSRYQLQLEFHLLDSQFAPAADNGKAAQLITSQAAAIATEGGLSYFCPRNADVLLYRRNDPILAGLITRIRNLPSPLSALHIEGLRNWIAERSIPNAHLEDMPGERFVYQEVRPRAVLTIQGGIKRTELLLVFAYDGVECAFHDDEQTLSRLLPDKTTVVMKRQREHETALLTKLREITAEMAQFESGLYANLIAKRTVPDISVVCELSEFVTRFGAAVIAAGIELRMEGRKVRSGGGLSFRAESDADWFGFRAGWKPDAPDSDTVRALDGKVESVDSMALAGNGYSTGNYALVVDEHLDQFGVAGATEPDGSSSWIMLGKRDIDRLKLLRKLGMDSSGVIETSPVNVTLIDSLYDQTENRDESHILRARELVRALGEFTSRHIEASHFDDSAAPGTLPEGLLPQPAGLQATLRNYQLIGFNWLNYLHGQQLGGCLADDMGLGKTVQTIALLQSLKEKNELGPSLLITPVVTLPNWEDEIARFAPTLRISRHAGSGRATSVAQLLQIPPHTDDTDTGSAAASVDIIMVSYHTLRNDLDLFVQTEWDYIILDEAHYIKNAGSQIFKAIRVLPSRHRLSLTGTPIENSTMELWSQFSFLNPGLLGSRKKFMSDVAIPIERDASEEALGTLRDTISPFILRRRKEDVLADLPPKSEILHWCEMGSDQARLYEEHRAMYRDQIAGILNDKGVEKSSMDIFRCLLRLRQIAINPAMISRKTQNELDSPDDERDISSPYSHISSAKMESLRMILDESMQEDHKTLVFSQFVSTLKLISRDLEKAKIRHALLTGATTDRRTQVHAFQNDPDLRLFLLSLKAGGVGINLTQADYVVLFDPWWNPAAERQAVDRAHRIGQKRPVLVYKFITRDTIEEKILALQAKKHQLAGNLIDGGDASFFHGMNADEIMDLFGK